MQTLYQSDQAAYQALNFSSPLEVRLNRTRKEIASGKGIGRPLGAARAAAREPVPVATHCGRGRPSPSIACCPVPYRSHRRPDTPGGAHSKARVAGVAHEEARAPFRAA